MNKLIWPVLALTLASVVAVPARAGQSLCGPYAAIAGQLRAKFHERPIYRWPNPGGSHVVEFWRSDSGRTISILAIDSRAWACVIAIGANAEAVTDVDKTGEGV